MHFTGFHFTDFRNEAAHLTHAEKGLYIELLELYVIYEKGLTADLNKLKRLSKAESIEMLEAVLDDFFVLDGDVYKHERMDQEIEKSREYLEKKSRAGKKSGQSRKSNSKNDNYLKTKRTDNEQCSSTVQTEIEHCSNTDGTPIELTNNQTPITNNQYTTSGVGGAGGMQRQECAAADAASAPPQASPPDKPEKSPPKAKAKRGTRLADDFVMPDTWITDAISWRPDLSRDQIRTESTVFANYWQAKSGASATKVDWHKTWHNWVLKAHAKPEKKVRSASEIKTFQETDWNAGLKHQNEDGTYAF